MPDESEEGGAVSLRFSGEAGEYFRIWIVNVCLSVVTLGIYSAWAKVRRKKYFYGNTLLNGASFEYLADPKAILKGRLIVFGLFVVYQGLNHLAAIERVSKGISPVRPASNCRSSIALWFALPELIIRTLSFNARNTAIRSVRFRFGARSRIWRKARVSLCHLLFGPSHWAFCTRTTRFASGDFILDNTSYGATPFSFDAEAGDFYWAYAKSTLMFLAFLAGSIVTLGIGILPFYILFASYRDAVVARLSLAAHDARESCDSSATGRRGTSSSCISSIASASSLRLASWHPGPRSARRVTSCRAFRCGPRANWVVSWRRRWNRWLRPERRPSSSSGSISAYEGRGGALLRRQVVTERNVRSTLSAGPPSGHWRRDRLQLCARRRPAIFARRQHRAPSLLSRRLPVRDRRQ